MANDEIAAAATHGGEADPAVFRNSGTAAARSSIQTSSPGPSAISDTVKKRMRFVAASDCLQNMVYKRQREMCIERPVGHWLIWAQSEEKEEVVWRKFLGKLI